MFNGGLDKDTLENSTAGEIAAITATDFVRSTNAKFYDPDKPEGWTVSFEDVVKGFLWVQLFYRVRFQLTLTQLLPRPRDDWHL